MPDNLRIEDLRGRVQRDPASVAFAQLAEECRRLGLYQEAVDVCRAGLAVHPGYLSARVTLGRALFELNLLSQARAELETVLESAPENLAAIQGIADIQRRQGLLPDALARYRIALNLAPSDPQIILAIQQISDEIDEIKVARPAQLSPLDTDASPDPGADSMRKATLRALENLLTAIHVARTV